MRMLFIWITILLLCIGFYILFVRLCRILYMLPRLILIELGSHTDILNKLTCLFTFSKYNQTCEELFSDTGFPKLCTWGTMSDQAEPKGGVKYTITLGPQGI